MGSDNEVNISSKTRGVFMEALALWNEADPVILSTAAQYSIKSDPKKRCDLFEASLREIKIMLYQVRPSVTISIYSFSCTTRINLLIETS